MLNLATQIPDFKRENPNLNRSDFMGISKGYNPELYESHVVKDKQHKVKGFKINRKRGRDMSMYRSVYHPLSSL